MKKQNRTEQNRTHFIDTFCGVVSFGRMYKRRNGYDMFPDAFAALI